MAGTIVQLWFQASVTLTPMVGLMAPIWAPYWALGLAELVNLVVVAKGGASGTLTEGVTELIVCAVPIEIVACDGTKSGSSSAWARL